MIYVEACEAGSMFEGLLKKNLNILAVTASNAIESSYGTYCGEMYPPPPPEYDGICLGDAFSVSWLEDRYYKEKKNQSLWIILIDCSSRHLKITFLFSFSNVLTVNFMT